MHWQRCFWWCLHITTPLTVHEKCKVHFPSFITPRLSFVGGSEKCSQASLGTCYWYWYPPPCWRDGFHRPAWMKAYQVLKAYRGWRKWDCMRSFSHFLSARVFNGSLDPWDRETLDSWNSTEAVLWVFFFDIFGTAEDKTVQQQSCMTARCPPPFFG